MTDSSSKAKSIFLAAIEEHAPEQWPAFLHEACGDDADLRGRVEQLLRARSVLGSFHEASAPTIDQPMREGPGTVIGRYKLLQQIGEGGMGTVYMAEQTQSVQRKVALKIIKPGMDSSQVIARFEAERQALAMMDHANIARVLDVGATEAGRPYFVMELVHGVSITKYCDDNRLTPRERLELFVPVCQAIQHAHQKGIIHRDIKPSNVMITLSDGKPVPKVIDFGVAKATEQRLTERTLFTQYGAMVGTPEYMSPEQAEMSAMGVDTRSDIYSLGVLLYELLTGSTPLINKRVRDAGFSEILRMIKEEEPPRPSNRLSDSGAALASISALRQTEPGKLALLLRGEVDWIVMKCLEKDRTRRYESAAGLARDVQRYLADEPVEACPPSALYRLRKLARKHKAALGILSACGLVLLIGVIVSTWQALVTAAAFVLVLFVAVVVSTWLAVRAMLAEGRGREAARQMQLERDRAQLALTRQVAQRLDAEMRQLAAVGHSIEVTLAQREDWHENLLTTWLTDLLSKDDRIHGLTLAFEPFQFDKKREEFCLYVWHSPEGIRPKRLLSPEYRYRDWDWYKKPIAQQRPLWIGPFIDTGGGEIPMVSYAVPLRQRGRCVGALTVDLPVEYFKRLWSWLAELNLGKRSYGFVISGTGLFIHHPKFRIPCKITELEKVDPEFAALARRMLKGEAGSGIAVDPSTDKRATFLFAPVPSAGWSFVAVIEE